MAKRKMTAKLFNRAAMKTTPEDFLVEHWEWLHTHRFLAPLLNAYQKQEITADAAINACREVLLVHEIRGQIVNAEETLKKALVKSVSNAGSNNYTVTVYCKFFDTTKNEWGIKIGTVEKKRVIEDEAGKPRTFIEEKDMVYGTKLCQEANRMAALRLANREDAVFAEIVSNFGPKIFTRMTRDEALGIVYPKERSPAQKRTSSGLSKPFKNFQRSRNTHVRGPWDIRLPV